MLEVVEEEEQAPTVHDLRQRPATSERSSCSRADVGGIRQRREWHPPHPVGVRLSRIAGSLEGKPRLPRAARPGEGQKSDVVAREQLPDVGELVLAAEKGSRGNR